MGPKVEEQFAPFEERMQKEGVHPAAIQAFRHYYFELMRGETGLIPEDSIAPVEELPDSETFRSYEPAGRAALAKTVILKLNGGLGTSMGLDRAKSLLIAKDGLTFLDITARHVLRLREKSGHAIPLLLMNSFSTHQDTLDALRAYPELDVGLPLGFLQNRIPKVLEDGYRLPDESAGENAWCPPGHGDLYVAMHASGLLDALLRRGFEYLFVSNVDNLGAAADDGILGYFAERRLPFLMEAADRTEADKKGGHLARRADARLILREVAQCPPEETAQFQDVRRYRYFNTNNLWVHLPALRDALDQGEGVLKLPLIRNRKTLNPRDPSSPAVIQLETAMGSAIELFERAAAVRVPRMRFAPVKLTSDLLTLWSDAYVLTDEYRVLPNPDNAHGIPVVELDPRYYRFVDQLSERFPYGAPSLMDCERLEVKGDVTFGKAIVLRDRVLIDAESASVEDGAMLTGHARATIRHM